MSPGAALDPQSTPAGVQAVPCQIVDRSSAGPGYSPTVSVPSRVGAVAAWLITVVGTRSSESVSLAEPPSYEVAIPIGYALLVARVVSVLVTWNVTVVDAPGARLLYGLDVASALNPAGRVSVTLPLCAAVDQLCTSTGTDAVSPRPIELTAAERPSASAAGAVWVAHWSYSAYLPQRW